MPKSNGKKPVLVTGGSGYIASWIVKALLDGGYTVHATVRSLDNQERVEHLQTMAEQSLGALTLFEADLLDEGSFDTAMEGCELVIHTASPVSLNPKLDPEEALIKPILEGTRNVLNSVNRTDTVKRVVLTSTLGAIYGDYLDLQKYPGRTALETNWNTTSSPKHLPYSYSKTMAEKLAWSMTEAQDRWDMVVINPGWVLGPSLSKRKDNVSSDLLLAFVDGRSAQGAVPYHFGIVDVRDVAEAHIKAGLQPESNGRYILLSEVLWHKEIAAILNARFGGDYSFPKRVLPKWFCWLMAPAIPQSRKVVAKNYGFEFHGDNSRSIESLGMSYRPAETTLLDQFTQLVEGDLVL